jgi:hypothetical protein
MATTLPEKPAPNGVNPTLLDFGITLRPATGGPVAKVDRPGSRFRIEASFPPMVPSVARVFISRLLEAKRSGHLLIEFPLLGESQGSPGSPVVDGAGQAGATLRLRSLNPGYRIKEGYWLSIIDANGQHYLHNARSVVKVGGDGRAAFGIEPPLRHPFVDGARVLLAQPMVEGFIDGGEWSWSVDVARFSGISFLLEEAA